MEYIIPSPVQQLCALRVPGLAKDKFEVLFHVYLGYIPTCKEPG